MVVEWGHWMAAAGGPKFFSKNTPLFLPNPRFCSRNLGLRNSEEVFLKLAIFLPNVNSQVLFLRQKNRKFLKRSLKT
ncbi:hypothetical protein NEPTK9_001395 [Candidatus Neptunochlamydia vexilliferae]|uniref:Uncharacterized protein n=1 Tax=Candidatus Neptunichlamydia vexilliferae TaxID=1651774 RepID=A0ABS0B0F2_9BACT|nr:hypothetical protein [Candidatus Neptunochlamydia vexilliferae]